MKNKLKFAGIDEWNRPVFKKENSKLFYGSVNVLFSYTATAEEVREKIKIENLEYFGSRFNCEPMGGAYLSADEWEINW